MNNNKTALEQEIRLAVVAALIFVLLFMWLDTVEDVKNVYYPIEKGMTNRLIFTFFESVVMIGAVFYLYKSMISHHES